jgi:hypothetical protein
MPADDASTSVDVGRRGFVHGTWYLRGPEGTRAAGINRQPYARVALQPL